ncbi:hypothetical protein HY029_01580 [Candidatus Gottesmanbacteria bacterium]|nr:hypothetical protein [Candidatus Gottesmanbacteria bacterium]
MTASRTHWDYGPGVFEFPTNFSEHKIKTRWWIYVGDLRGTLRDGSIVQLPRVWVGGEYPARASLTSQFWDDESHKTMVVSLATKQVVSSLTKLNKPDFDSGSREDINVIFGDLQKAFGKQLSQVGFNTMSIDKPQFGD